MSSPNNVTTKHRQRVRCCAIRMCHAEHIPHLCTLCLFQHLFKFLIVLIIWFGSRKTGRSCHEIWRKFSNSCTGSLRKSYLHKKKKRISFFFFCHALNQWLILNKSKKKKDSQIKTCKRMLTWTLSLISYLVYDKKHHFTMCDISMTDGGYCNIQIG